MKHWILFIFYFLAPNFHSLNIEENESLMIKPVGIAPSNYYISKNTKPQHSSSCVVLASPFTQQEEDQDEDENENDWNHSHQLVHVNPSNFFFNQSRIQHYEDTNATLNAHQLRVFSPPEFDC